MDKIIIIGGKGSAVAIAEQIYDTQMKTHEIEFLGFAFDDESSELMDKQLNFVG